MRRRLEQRGQHFDYEVSISLDLPSRRKADTVGRILKREAYGKTLLRSFSRCPEWDRDMGPRNGIRVDSSRPMPPPSWFRAAVHKLARCTTTGRAPRAAGQTPAGAGAAARPGPRLALLTQTEAVHCRGAPVERLSLERELVSLNMTAAEVDGKISFLPSCRAPSSHAGPAA